MEKKDWIGNKATAFGQMGARNFAKNSRQGTDYYATPPKALEDLLKYETFSDVWECADGEGHLCRVLEKRGLLKRHSDLIDRGCGEGGVNFLAQTGKWEGDIITNPPYRFAQQFVEKALHLIPEGRKVAMLLKVQFLESKSRVTLFKESPPKIMYVWSGRISCALNGQFENITHGSPMMFAWFVWEKGFWGDPVIRWLDWENDVTDTKQNLLWN